MQARTGQDGFTLIELVVVITILGILAAFAIPRFVSLEVEARAAATEALGGSVRSASALTHALWLAQDQPATVTVEGQVVNMALGYPTVADINLTLADTTGFTFAGGVWEKTGATTPANCSVTYTAPPAAGQPPGIAVDTSGC